MFSKADKDHIRLDDQVDIYENQVKEEITATE